MSNLRNAAKQVLEVLDSCEDLNINQFRAVAALRAALAQPEQEPVAWMYEGEPFFDGNDFVKTYRYTDSKELAEFKSGTIKKPQSLYAHPPQRKPLTDVEIMEVCRNIPAYSGIIGLVRAFEEAHGIV
jgi:hypothetical protein